MADLPTPEQLIGNSVTEVQFKNALKQLIENIISTTDVKTLVELMGTDSVNKANQYADVQKIQKFSGLARRGVLYEVTDAAGNQTWLQVSDSDGMPTPFAKSAIRTSSSIEDGKKLIIAGEPILYAVRDSLGNQTALAVRTSDGQLATPTVENIKNRIGIASDKWVLASGEELIYFVDAGNGPTALAVRKKDGMFAEFVIQNIRQRLEIDNLKPNFDELQYKPKPSDFQVLSSIARGVARHVANKPLPSKITNFVNSTGQTNRLTFPNSYNDATPLILVICFEGVGDQSLDIRTAYSDVLNHGVIWARCAFHGDSYGSPKAMQDAIELYQKACEIAPIAGVVAVGNSMGGVAALNALTTETIPNILGVYLTDPVCDLRQRYENGRASEINTAYECDSSTYAVKTLGYDPILQHWSKFRGVPVSIVVTSNDSLVLKSLHTDKLVSKLTDHNKINVLDTKAPDHNAAAQFNVVNLISFINQCASGAVITAI